MAIKLSDDGTLDTVLRCDDCGEEFRYTFDEHDDGCENNSPDAPNECGCYERFVAWAIEDTEGEHVCSADAEPCPCESGHPERCPDHGLELAEHEPSEPDEDDITTTDHETFWQDGRIVLQRFGPRWRYYYSQGVYDWLPGRFRDDYRAALRAYMERTQFWPNAWWISDHGNAHLIDLTEDK